MVARVYNLEDRIEALKVWNKSQHEHFPNSLVMDSNALCDGCNKINFGALGFCGHGDPTHLFWDVIRRSFDEIQKNLEQCVFCRKIDEIFSEWGHRQFGNVTPYIRKVIVEVRECTLERPRNFDEKGFLQRIQFILYVR